MRSRIVTAAALAALVLGSLTERARADEAARQSLERIDGDASIVVLARPRGPRTLIEWLNKWGGPTRNIVQEGLREVFAPLKAQTSVDLSDPKAWGELGLDVDAPIAMGLFAIDHGPAEKAFGPLADPKREKTWGKVKRPWLRNRVVAKVTDEAKLRALLEAMAGRAWVAGKSDPAAAATALGLDAKQGKAVAAALKKAKISAALRSDQAFVFVTLGGGWLTIDVLGAFAGDLVPFDWKRDGAALMKVATRKIAKGGRASILDAGIGSKIGDADFALWGDPVRILESGKATGWHKTLSALKDVPPDRRAELAKAGADEVAKCEQFRPIAASGPFEDMALWGKITPTSIEWGGGWGMRKGYALASAFVTANDGLIDVGATTDAVALLGVYLNGLAPLRALPRAEIMTKDAQTIHQALMECGWGGAVVGVGFGWPQLMLVHLDEEGKRDAEAKSVFDHVRNFAIAFKTISYDTTALFGVMVASFDDSPDLAWLAREVGGKSGKPQTVNAGKRTITLYPARSKFEPSVVHTQVDGGKIAWGALFGGQAAVKWFWGKGGGTASPNAIALGRADVPAILGQLSKQNPYFGPYFEEAAKRFGMLRGSMEIQGDLLVGEMKLELK
jgi:hypothetical protein